MNETFENEQTVVSAEAAPERKSRKKAAPAVQPEQELIVNHSDNPETIEEQHPAFDPSRYLMKIDGRDYLEVKCAPRNAR